MNNVIMPGQGDLSNLLALIDLVKLAADADKSRGVLEDMRAAVIANDETRVQVEDERRRLEAVVRVADERVAEADRAEAVAANIIGQAQAIRAEAGAELEAAAQARAAAEAAAAGIAAAEAAVAATQAEASRVLAAAKAEAETIEAQAKEVLDQATTELEKARSLRIEFENKRAQLLAVAGA